MDRFIGFDDPRENWSKLPHSLIEALPLVETLGELKVILYVLRHTWGFQEDQKKLTLDEFQHGRKKRNQERMNGGTGLARTTVIDGISRAIAHGFLMVTEDGSDKGRIKKYYELRMRDEVMYEVHTPEVAKSYPRGSETLPRTEKETLKKEHSKDSAPGTVRAETPKAVKVFRAAAHRFPPKAWYLDIASRVGGEEKDLIRWGEHVKSWVGRGYNPTNIEGILESFEQGGLKKRRQPKGIRAEETSADRRERYASSIKLMERVIEARRQADGTDG